MKTINIQNAVMVDDTILCSIDKYTKQSHNGVEISGGLVDLNIKINVNPDRKMMSLNLTVEDTIEEIMDTLLWVTVDDDGKFVYKFMKDLSEAHLKNISRVQKKSDSKANTSPIHLYIAKMLLKKMWLTKKQ